MFGYNRLTVRILHPDGTPEVEINNPENTTLESLRQFLEEEVFQRSNVVLKAALDDLVRVCDALHKENSVQNES